MSLTMAKLSSALTAAVKTMKFLNIIHFPGIIPLKVLVRRLALAEVRACEAVCLKNESPRRPKRSLNNDDYKHYNRSVRVVLGAIAFPDWEIGNGH